jgi:hypothetical protein
MWMNIQQNRLIRYRKRLGNGLIMPDGERFVFIGMLLKSLVQKKMAGHSSNGGQYGFIADAAPAKGVHHALAQAFVPVRINHI